MNDKLIKELETNKGSIIVANYQYFPLLFKFKNEHPSFDLTFITPDELSIKFYGIYKNFWEALGILISKGYSYDKAKQYSDLFLCPYFKDTKDKHLLEVYEYVKHLITVDPYGSLFFKNKKIYVFEDKDNRYVKSNLLANNLSFSDISFDDLGFEALEAFKTPNIMYFDDKFYQFFYIFSDLRRKILEDKNNINKYEILVEDKKDMFYIEMFSKIFGIKTYNLFANTLFDDNDVKKQLKVFWANKNFNIESDKLKIDILSNLDKIIKGYKLNEFNNWTFECEDKFIYAYNCLLEILKANVYRPKKDNYGILVTDKYTLNPNIFTYVTNFKDDCFFKSAKDTNVVSDEQLIKLGTNASYDLTILDKQLKLNYLKYHNCVLISRAKQHLDEHIYDSPLVEELGWKDKVQNVTFIKDKLLFKDGCSTTDAKHLYHICQSDVLFVTKPNKDALLNTYDCSFKKLDSKVKPKHYSASSLDNYANCPFKYYILDVLKLKPDEDKYNFVIGETIHKFFEKINHDDFDYDTQIKEAKKAYFDSLKNNGLDNNAWNEVFFEIIEHWLKKTYLVYRSEYIKIKNNNKDMDVSIDKDYEIQVDYELEGNKITGRIDKMLLTKCEDGGNGKTAYLSLIDFKTGMSSKFKPDNITFGKSLQLPIYYFALIYDPQFKDLMSKAYFGGFGIQRIWSKKFNDWFVVNHVSNLNNLLNYSFIDGYATEGSYQWTLNLDVDPNAEDPISLIQSVKFNKKTMNEDSFKVIEDIAKNAIISLIEKIKKNIFDVSPNALEPAKIPEKTEDLACSYCPLRNICYVNKQKVVMDYKNVKEVQ